MTVRPGPRPVAPPVAEHRSPDLDFGSILFEEPRQAASELQPTAVLIGSGEQHVDDET